MTLTNQREILFRFFKLVNDGHQVGKDAGTAMQNSLIHGSQQPHGIPEQ